MFVKLQLTHEVVLVMSLKNLSAKNQDKLFHKKLPKVFISGIKTVLIFVGGVYGNKLFKGTKKTSQIFQSSYLSVSISWDKCF